MLAGLEPQEPQLVAEGIVDRGSEDDERYLLVGDRLAFFAFHKEGAAHKLPEITVFHYIGRALEFDQREPVQQRQQRGEFPPLGFRKLPRLSANQQDVHAERHLADGYLLPDREGGTQRVVQHSHQ